MYLGIADASQRPVTQGVDLKTCTVDEPTVIGIVGNIRPGPPKKATITQPSWSTGCAVAHKAALRIFTKVQVDNMLVERLIDPEWRPTLLYWAMSDGNNLLFIWPKRFFDSYLERVQAGSAAAIPGFEPIS